MTLAKEKTGRWILYKIHQFNKKNEKIKDFQNF